MAHLNDSTVALYVHVPFCQARCSYCDFNTYAELGNLIPAYLKALCQEVAAARDRWGELRVSTVYIGGGTPSLLPLNLLTDLIGVVRATFDLSPCREITLEANPGTLTGSYLAGLRSLGIDRLSIGAQSAHEQELRMLGRIHSWDDVVRAVDEAYGSGFENLSLDLLFGLPGQSLDHWAETLEEALALEPRHLSLYGLTLEEGTPLGEQVASGDLPAPSEDTAAAMYELAEETLAEAGFFHYEISNWARMTNAASSPGDRRWWPGSDVSGLGSETSEAVSPYVCRHNMTYWRNEPWLGVGAGAYSWMTSDVSSDRQNASETPTVGERWANRGHPEDYVAACGRIGCSDSLRVDVERIDRRLGMGETMMLGLRLAEGVTCERFEARFGVRVGEVFGRQLESLRRLGLLTWDGAAVRLTGRGRLLGNRVFERFI